MLQRRSINRSALKTYAPKARSEFIAGVTARAAKFGITKDRVVEATHQGDLVIIGAEAFSRGVGERRQKLLQRIALHGFEQTMEEVAYTWFNRFLAIRFMELHGYLEHGYRVLSHPGDKELPEILEHAEHLELPGLDKAKVIDLKLDGTKDADLYRLLLIAQCNALHRAMPFLFEKIDDETELLLPDNLLHTDSLIRKLVSAIDEADWQEIEIIGWLYQFYISEKKDEVIGKVVKPEDIPAATQLFTPNWIVKYMVQNALGAQWLTTYPGSPLKAEMQYYVEPAEQTEEVKRQLAEITPKELNPEELTLIDPACGSGHILVEAYDLFKAIYLERGYRLRDIPRLILEKNLYGLDIDDRAAQMAGFALLMKARADDRRVFSSESAPVMNVMAIQDSKGLDAQRIAQTLLPRGRFELVPSTDLLPDTLAQPTLSAAQPSPVQAGTIAALLDLFAEGKTFGSLITVPDEIADALPALKALIQPEERDDIFQREAKQALAPLVDQAELLGRQYDAVVANPPYMGGKFMASSLKQKLRKSFPGGGNDIYCAFVLRGVDLAKHALSMITMETWMYVVSYEEFRSSLLSCAIFRNGCHLPYEGKRPTAMGINFGTMAFTMFPSPIKEYRASFVRQRYFQLSDSGCPRDLKVLRSGSHVKDSSSFEKIPTAPIAFDVSEQVLRVFDDYEPLSDKTPCKDGMTSGSNDLYVRYWTEVNIDRFNRPDTVNFEPSNSKPWVAYSKGGDFRKWYGNNELVVFWGANGSRIKSDQNSVIRNEKFYFRPALTWTLLSNFGFGARLRGSGYAFDTNGKSAFPSECPFGILGYLNSQLARRLLGLINPTIAFQAGDIGRLPKPRTDLLEKVEAFARRSCEIARSDWDAYEQSWEFQRHPLLTVDRESSSILGSFTQLSALWAASVDELERLEHANSAAFVNAYGLKDEIPSNTPIDEIALNCNVAYRYGSSSSEKEIQGRLLKDTLRELISYAVGCMMGRYSLDEPGLIYAKARNEYFEPARYRIFSADEDGILPVTEEEWFDDDVAVRFEEFLKVAWSSETLRDNLGFVAESLVENGGSAPQKAIRSYIARSFFSDHLKTYKRRPIYWLFSSGKLKAFECLVYLHRYNESTLSRMRMEYVVPLQSRMAARIDQLGDDVASASSSAARTKAQKEKDLLARQLEELRAFDEELRHYADQRIALDLDDGVKVNYGKFGNLLAERKAVTGEK